MTLRGSKVLLALAALPLLASCGGGFSFGFGNGLDDDEAPTVSISSNVSTVQAGQSLTLSATASDDGNVQGVDFFRDDNGTGMALCSDDSEPFQCVVNAPNDGRTAMTVYARARDDDGNTTRSASLTITITP